jgi:hypothetical protein
MSQQIIKQPNGKYALFSQIVGDFVLIDADPQDIVDEWVKEYKIDMEKKVSEIVSALERGEKPYYQFTMSFEKAVKKVRRNR